jgi:hypothetical protein
MNTAEIKLEIFRKLDSLDNNKIKDLYGLVLNFVNQQKSIEEWHELSEEQRQGLLIAEDQIKNGQGIPHAQIVSKFKKKLINA